VATQTSDVTPAASWNGIHSTTVTLPSGNTAELREKFPVYMMLRTGILDAEMFAAFNAWQDNELADPAMASRLVDLIVQAMFLNPKVTPDGAEGTVAIDEIADEDIDHVLELATGGSPGHSFPDDKPDGGGRGAGGADVESDAVKPARPQTGKSGGAKSRRAPRRKAA
jgi:hypothetical protein